MVAAVTDANELLLVREYAACAHVYELGFVKGKIDPGEVAEHTAQRELQEEVGFAAKELTFYRKMTMSPAYTDFETHLFVAKGLYPAEAEGDEIEPLEQIRWPLQDIAQLLNHPEVNDARVLAFLGHLEKLYLTKAI